MPRTLQREQRKDCHHRRLRYRSRKTAIVQHLRKKYKHEFLKILMTFTAVL